MTAEERLFANAEKLIQNLPADDQEVFALYVDLRIKSSVGHALHWRTTRDVVSATFLVACGLAVGIPLALYMYAAVEVNSVRGEMQKKVDQVQERCIEKVMCDCAEPQ